MIRLIIQLKNDTRLIFRDPILYVMLFVPWLIIGILRFGLPPLTGYFPGLVPYMKVILGTFCIVISMFPAFIYSFVLLDEKDQDVLTVIRILPVSSIAFIVIRLILITFISYVYVVLTILITGLLDWSPFKTVLVSLPISLVAPVMTLFMAGMARNKIEGTTWMKGLNFIMFLPVLSYFIEGNYEYALGILPVYWIFKMFDPGFSVIPFRINFLFALVFHLTLLYAGIRIFRRKVFPR
jgi:hypothetical protein